MADYLAMGGYAAFVWPVYGLAAIVFVGLFWYVRADLARQRKLLKALETVAPDSEEPE